MHDGRWEVAESLFTDALDISQADDRAHWGLAESYWNRGDKELAAQQMEQAVRLSAGDPRFVGRLGEMYLELGRLAEADQHSQMALSGSRDSPEAWRLRGDCLRAAGQADEALGAYHRALALQPDFPAVQIQAADIYRSQERFDRLLATLDQLEDSMGADKTPSRADLLQGIALRKMGRSGEARRSFVRAGQKDPGDAAPHLELAMLALDEGDFVSADLFVQTALSIDPAKVEEERWATIFEQQQQQRLAADRNPVSTLNR
ncbi:cellulose synthase subunit BcsC [Rubripirellula obstinata]|uniref:Cellulose synthase subunit BcsC n=2 Tax=Rubripirellula obstinata TaxID=406547 RepID=A0A5B1CJX7_9BACT|nr:cellulose synthase subunit BcsC [Rubripirellula obstinata]